MAIKSFRKWTETRTNLLQTYKVMKNFADRGKTTEDLEQAKQWADEIDGFVWSYGTKSIVYRAGDPKESPVKREPM